MKEEEERLSGEESKGQDEEDAKSENSKGRKGKY